MRDDLILRVGRVETGRPGPAPAAIAIRGGRIAWIGSARDSRRRTGPRIELDGAVALPGLVDAHTHPLWLGQGLEQLDLTGLAPPSIVAALDGAPGEGWIRGFGWTELGPLDRLPQSPRPTLLHRLDRHVAWANRAALEAAGVGRSTPDPDGGRFVRDASGAPSGLCHDNAIRRILDAEPPPTPADRIRWLTAASDRFAAAGLTAIHDVCASTADVRAWRAVEARRVRVHAVIDGEDADRSQIRAVGPRLDPWLSVAGVKFFADGALGSRTAWLGEPYADADHAGLPGLRGPALRSRAAAWAAEGFQVAIHAIGDAAAREALAALAPLPPARHRIEHAQVVDPATVAAIGAAGLVVGIQPTHAVTDAPWLAERLGSSRLRWAFPWRPLAEAGARLILGSDTPIAAADPIAALRAAVRPPRGDGLSFDHALRACTIDAAWAAFADRGPLAPGAVADITVLDRDPRAAIDRGEPLSVRATFVGGRATFGPR